MSWRSPRPSSPTTTAPPRRCGPLNRASRLERVSRSLQALRRAAAEHRVCRYDGDDRLYRAGPHSDPQERQWLAADAGLDRRVRLDRLHSVCRAAAGQSIPLRGRFVSANNKIVPDTYPYFLSRDWDLPNRAERIDELLAATASNRRRRAPRFRPIRCRIAARRLVPLMSRIVPKDELSREAIERLRAWDFRMDRTMSSRCCLLLGCGPLPRRFSSGQLGDAGKDYWDLHPEVIETVLTDYSEWCAISTVSGVGASFRGSSQSGEGRGGDEQALIPAGTQPNGCDALLSATLDSALAGLRETYGPDMAHMAMGARPCREVSERGIHAHPGAARLDRRRDTDRRRVRHGQPRVDDDPRR